MRQGHFRHGTHSGVHAERTGQRGALDPSRALVLGLTPTLARILELTLGSGTVCSSPTSVEGQRESRGSQRRRACVIVHGRPPAGGFIQACGRFWFCGLVRHSTVAWPNLLHCKIQIKGPECTPPQAGAGVPKQTRWSYGGPSKPPSPPA